MLTINEPQVWTLMGVFAASTLGMMTLVVALLSSTLKSGFARIEARIDSLDRTIATMDRDINVLMKNAFGIDRS